MPGLIEEAVRLGIESPSLRKQYIPLHQKYKQAGEAMDWNIQYHPKDIASVVTLIKQCGVQSYLALDSSNTGGHRFIEEKCKIQTMKHIPGGEGVKEEKQHFKKLDRFYDLVSIDSREYKTPPERIWQWLQGGIEDKSGFGVGAPANFGIRKISPKGLILINLTKEDDRKLFFLLRRRYNKAYQSQYCGLIKL